MEFMLHNKELEQCGLKLKIGYRTEKWKSKNLSFNKLSGLERKIL
jgi:hypothetical protein